MTFRFSASALDLSRIDRASLWPTHSFEAIRQARLDDLKARLTAAGIPYNVDASEADPGVYLQESSGYRELLKEQALDDAQAKVLLAFAWGPYLDRLGDGQGCARLPGESDDRYRTRIQLAPEAFSACGTPGGYIYHAASVSTDVRDVGLAILNRGTPDVMVEVTILSAIGDGAPSPALLDAIRARLADDAIKQLTDTVIVRGAVILNYSVVATQFIRPGPDPTLVRNLGEQALRAAADRYKRIAGPVPRNAIDAALYVPNVDRVLVSSPAGDLTLLRFQATNLADVQITTVVTND